MSIPMQEIQSSNVKSIGYDEETKTLAVEFKNGATYHYDGVPKDEWETARTADSFGTHFHANIKNRYTGVKQ